MELQQQEQAPIGVLLMEYGEPTALTEVIPYLRAHSGGYEPEPEAIADLTARCRRVWGAEHGDSAAGRLVAGVARALASRHGNRFRVALGARHWQPDVTDALADLVRLGVRQVVVVPLSPHPSSMSLRDYHRAIERAEATLEAPVALRLIADWSDLAGWRTVLVENAHAAFERLAGEERQASSLLFLAHSVAESARKPETDYQERLHQHAGQLAETLGCATWRVAYYGAEGPGQWLGPDGSQALAELARAGARRVLAVPLATVYQNVEVCYELDVRLAERAAELGLVYERSTIPDAAPRLVTDLAALVVQTAEQFERADARQD